MGCGGAHSLRCRPYSRRVPPANPAPDDRSSELLSDFFDNAAVGLHWQARDGVVQRVNHAMLELLGLASEDFVGHNIAEFHVDPNAAHDIAQRLARGETLHSYQARLRASDGTVRDVLLSANVLWEGGEFVYARCFTRDVSALRAARHAIEEADRSKAAILNASLDAIITMDAEGRLVDFNPAAERIFGYPRVHAIGRPLADLIIPPSLRQAHIDGLRRYLATGEGPVLGKRIEITALHADGHEFPVELSIAVVGGAPPMFTATLRNITRRKKAEQALKDALAALQESEARLREALEERKLLLDSERAARAAAERLSDVKDQFLATLSHELRTPLNAILGWAQILQRRTASPEDLRKGMETIERGARAQARMIEELLDTSRIASGKIPLELQPLDFGELVRAAVDAARPSAADSQVMLEVDAPGRLPIVQGDPHRLQQVVGNLLANAVKFTPAGGRITVSLRHGQGTVELAVMDTGEGMDPGFVPQAFERFRQADASITRRHGGLGLGLAIVRGLVELHGGSVQALSEGKGRGSTFIVRLPAAKAVAAAPSQAGGDETQAGAIEALAGVVALVVEDDADARDLLQRLLHDWRIETIAAAGAAEALELLAQRSPDFIVSDIGMPDIDGFELMRRVRALPPERGGTIPALALTAFARPEDADKAMQAGFDAHLRKPIEPPELLAALLQLRALQAARQPE